jgi:hypothetical protein
VFDPAKEDAFYLVQSAPRAFDALLFVRTTSSAVPALPSGARSLAHPLLDQPSNLDFEATPVEAAPPGWLSPTSEGGYQVLVDEDGPAEGKRCARLDREGERRKTLPFGNIMQSVSAVPYRGKRVRLRAWVRTNVTGPGNQARLWLRVDRGGNLRGFFNNMEDRPITDPRWNSYEIVGDVAADAVSLNFGLILLGGGRAWIDSLTLETVEHAPDS